MLRELSTTAPKHFITLNLILHLSFYGDFCLATCLKSWFLTESEQDDFDDSPEGKVRNH